MIKLREATSDDSFWVWELANDPAVRAVSFNSAPIPRGEHETWFKERLADADHVFFIAENETDERIGQLRFAISGTDAEIAISIPASQRGKGLGAELIRKASSKLFRETAVERIFAYAKPDNIASVKAFEKADFARNGCAEKHGCKAVELILRTEGRVDVSAVSFNERNALSTMGFEINGRRIGSGEPVYIIAEISANHNGDYKRAAKLIRAAAKAGADAVKLQTYTADTLTIDCRNKYFTIDKGTAWAGKNLYDLYREAYTPWQWQPELKKLADNLGISCFSTPFDASAVDFLEKIDVPAYKVASFEIVDIPLIKYAASKQKPMIISTGMATEDEIRDVVDAVYSTGNKQLALLKCTSAYPAVPEDMNLKTIPDIAERFKVISGLSDHSLTTDIAVASIALGACVIEKHITLSRVGRGHDAGFSLEPHEFKQMAESIRIVEKALGKVNYQITEGEKASRVFRRSLFAVKDIKAGEKLTVENVRSIRPGNGLSPKYYAEVVGRAAQCDIERGAPLDWGMIGE